MYHLAYYSIKIKEERVMGVTNNPTESEVCTGGVVGACAWISCSLWPVLCVTWRFKTKNDSWRKR